MLFRKTLSIVLAAVFFACAASFIAVLFYLLQLSSFAFSVLLTASNLNVVALMLLCIILGIVLLACAGRKVRPVQVAVWGAGVLFFSLSFSYQVATVIYNIIIGYAVQLDIFSILMLAGILVSFLAGIAACAFAAALNRRLVKGTLKELPAKARPAEFRWS